MTKKIKKIAIANRGEIAVRLISTCLEMGIKPVLLYSLADKNSLAYRLSPEKVCIGPGPASKSYLSVPAVVAGALKAGVEALHPGYGFLSEKAELAKACLQNNLIFIGPPVSALETFGSKTRARELAVKCGLPVLPAKKISVNKAPWKWTKPVMIKAIHGGGGRGLKLVRLEREWKEALMQAQSSAKSIFGSSEVFVEEYLPFARHIEVQVFVSAKGEAFYLFDRDCSVQRKHAKIVEEAPALLPSSVKKQMAEASLALLSAVDYRQAGTVEFLYHDGKFYFIEVNPRIQVESPVTEMILRVDLVRAQILTAQGLSPFMSKSFVPRGHSLQCRIYAEDMAQQRPVFGQLGSCYFPQGAGRRFDRGYESKDIVPAFYDTMLGKLIVHGENRQQAQQKMKQALRETVIFGVQTNLSFLQGLISHKKFIKGDMHTHFVEEEFLKTYQPACVGNVPPALLSSLGKVMNQKEATAEVGETFNPWTDFAFKE